MMSSWTWRRLPRKEARNDKDAGTNERRNQAGSGHHQACVGTRAIRQTDLEAPSQVDVARPTGDARGDHSSGRIEDCAGGRFRSESGELQSACSQEQGGNPDGSGFERPSGTGVFVRAERVVCHGPVARHGKRERADGTAARGDAPIALAESLVSSSRAIVGLSAIAGGPGSKHLWP